MRHRVRMPAVFAAALVAAVLSVEARQSNPAAALSAQIDRIFKNREYSAPRFGPARWLPDGTAYAIVERTASGKGSDIVRYEAATGARTVLVPGSKLVRPDAKPDSVLDVDDYEWSPDGERLLIFTNTRKVWRDNTRGDYWWLDVASGQLRKIGNHAPASTLMFGSFPRIAPALRTSTITTFTWSVSTMATSLR